ncbi:carboxypeptidase-like regulatory domain-containing protein [Pedobacter gandavensis]|uniref:TonB-dependent receptor plug domain-containing protein n=1 Tax=Pedobacter gandavensis TaxID=2679963 RepID=A0ABR6F0M3_9SPHI|nr:carboxypeptidase-like regulatory domain-containing protein [Pedobacter gandavensis]MBB2151057.1 TonB-dependent receptor plug domain-containing protein [Pedobacter gandavensis]
MKRKVLYPLLLITGVFLAFAGSVLDDNFDVLLERMKELNQKYPQEKVHLHLDKPYYAIGDNIWFKAYLYNSTTQEPSNISNILYVELINERDSIKQKLRLPVIAGSTWGNFMLPDTLTEGNYRIRAYTQWMRNTGPEFFFDKTIKIGYSWTNQVSTNTTYNYSKESNGEKVEANISFKDKDGNPYVGNEVRYEVQLDFKSFLKGKATTNNQGEISLSFLNNQPDINKKGRIIATISLPEDKKITREIPIKATSRSVDVQFFPESGNLISGLPTKVAVKSVNSSGRGENISGIILDENGLEINRFETKHLGMGNFIINPQDGIRYRAKVKFADGSEKEINLPITQNSGYGMTVLNTDQEKLTIKVMRSANLTGPVKLRLVGQHNGNVLFSPIVTITDQLATIHIPKKDLLEGILQLSLFSETNQPIAERLAFIYNPSDRATVKLSTEKTVYAKREQVAVQLNSTFNGSPVSGMFSVSVTNNNAVKPEPETESNILSNLLLSQDLIGYIEQPNYYFIEEGPEVAKNMDNLMLTQGWRRILWKNVVNGIPPIIRFQPEKSLGFSGVVTNYSGKPAPNSKVTLLSTASGFFSLDTLTDAQGRFNFDRLVFLDDPKFIIQARTDKGKKRLDIKMDIVPDQVVTKSKNTGDIEINVNEALSGYLKQSNNYFDDQSKRGILQRTLQLKEVKITQQKEQAKNSQNLNGAGRADAIITAEQLSTCTTLSMCLQGRVAGLTIMNGKAYLMRNGGRIPMAIVLDGMRLEDADLDIVNVNDIETVEVLKSIGNTAIYGSGGSGGVLVITTKRGVGDYSSTITPGLIVFNPKGYTIPKEFYSPKYDTAQPSNGPDFRSTVYWGPQLLSGAEGKTNFTFFNTDEPGTYRVVLEGMDLMGHLARTVYTYEVK